MTATWPTDWVGRADWRLRGMLVRGAVGFGGFVRDVVRDTSHAGDRMNAATADWMLRTNWPVRPLRIGIVGPGDWSVRLLDATSTCDTEWFALRGDPRDLSLSRRTGGAHLDAMIQPLGGDGLLVATLEHDSHEAAWFDWAMDRPLSYPAVFPTRLDGACLTLHALRAGDTVLARRLIEAAAVYSRHPARLTLADLASGRLPTSAPHALPTTSKPRPYLPNHGAASSVMRILCDELTGKAAGPRLGVSSAERAAARLCGAWLATVPGGIDDAERGRFIAAAAHLTGEEPTTMLRLAAVRLATQDDDAGLDAILRADRMLRDSELLPSIDHSAFIAGELEHGSPTAMTIGRLAAGTCMIASTMPASKAPYFLADLLDDVRFSSLLVGRDHDRTLLERMCRELARARRVETFSLPAAAARPRSKRRRKAA